MNMRAQSILKKVAITLFVLWVVWGSMVLLHAVWRTNFNSKLLQSCFIFYFFHKLKKSLLKIGFTLSHKCQPKPINVVICLEADEGIKAALERK